MDRSRLNRKFIMRTPGSPRHPAVRLCALAAAATGLLALGGCSPGDIQLEGKIFDAVGIGSNQQKAREPKLAERAPLVVPPALNRLPDPNAEAAEQPVIAGVTDHDAGNTASRVELERQQAEYCKKNYELPKAQGLDEADSATGPLGPCRASVLTQIPKALAGGADDE